MEESVMSPERRAEDILRNGSHRPDLSIIAEAVDALARELDVEPRHVADEVAAMLHKAANLQRLRRDVDLRLVE
jgi:hypothetical protein